MFKYTIKCFSPTIISLFLRTYFIVSPDKTIKLWKISERDKRPEGYNLKEEDGRYRDPTTVTTLRVSMNGALCLSYIFCTLSRSWRESLQSAPISTVL